MFDLLHYKPILLTCRIEQTLNKVHGKGKNSDKYMYLEILGIWISDLEFT